MPDGVNAVSLLVAFCEESVCRSWLDFESDAGGNAWHGRHGALNPERVEEATGSPQLEEGQIGLNDSDSELAMPDLDFIDDLSVDSPKEAHPLQINAHDLTAETSPLESKGSSARAEGCVICMERASDFAIVPCGHRCLCQICSRNLTKCPVCRTYVQGVLKIFDCSLP